MFSRRVGLVILCVIVTLLLGGSYTPHWEHLPDWLPGDGKLPSDITLSKYRGNCDVYRKNADCLFPLDMKCSLDCQTRAEYWGITGDPEYVFKLDSSIYPPVYPTENDA